MRKILPRAALQEMLEQHFGITVLLWDVANDGEFLGAIVEGDSDIQEMIDSYAKFAATETPK